MKLKVISSSVLLFVLFFTVNAYASGGLVQTKSLAQEGTTTIVYIDAETQITIISPPSGWDAVNATDQELSRYGYPPRPSNENDLVEWKKIASGKWFKPEFEIDKSVEHPGEGVVRNSTQIYSSMWSGVIKDPGSVRSRVAGYWRQPYATAATTSRPAFSSQWIGLGGYNENVIIQAGTESNIYTDSSGGYDVWYEIIGTNITEDQINIPNFPHSPGDTYYADISFSKGNNGTASFYILDCDTESVTSFNVSNIQYNYDLTSAEWIFERPLVNDALAPNFTRPDNGSTHYVHFASCASSATPTGTLNLASTNQDTLDYVALLSQTQGGGNIAMSLS